MAKTGKQVIVNALLKEIELGKQRSTALARAVKRWQISARTFDRHWKTANEMFTELQQKAKKASDKAYIKASKKAAVEAVMSKIERMETLSKIARGEIPLTKPMVVDGAVKLIPVVPDWMDRKAAIAELNKMEGDYAPTKVAQTDSKGNDIEKKDLPQLSTEEIINLLDKRSNT
jgi:hypothetical protein